MVNTECCTGYIGCIDESKILKHIEDTAADYLIEIDRLVDNQNFAEAAKLKAKIDELRAITYYVQRGLFDPEPCKQGEQMPNKPALDKEALLERLKFWRGQDDTSPGEAYGYDNVIFVVEMGIYDLRNK